ncbi:MAG: urea ABC transporter ATP-binding protein UrtD [Desulfovibrio sp.]|jgi:urea transport system ATP-binding protein|nr:urea ABC transporter ATP-binding protein UrtD [Desulfovibrio sp.]
MSQTGGFKNGPRPEDGVRSGDLPSSDANESRERSDRGYDAWERQILDSLGGDERLKADEELQDGVRELVENYHKQRGMRPAPMKVRPPRALRSEGQHIALYLENISVSFDGFQALHRLTLYMDEGELRCIIGPNGAGKTTMMDVITGKTRPDRGVAWFTRKCNLLAMDEVDIAQAGICRKFQKPSVFEALSVQHNLELACSGDKSVFGCLVRHLTGEQKDARDRVLERIYLVDRRDVLAGTLSHGQKQWLEIGMLLMQRPKLLLLDEPVAGMSPQEVDRTVELLKELEGEQSIMLVEHDMAFVRAIAKKVTVLHQGTVLAEGTMDEIRNDPEVVKAYLGEEQC